MESRASGTPHGPDGSKDHVRPHPLLVTESDLRREVAQGYDRLSLSPKERATRRGYLHVHVDGRLEEY